MELTPGKIFLADQRGFVETSILRRYTIFNFEKYYSEHREPLGELFLCNDESIAGGKLSFFLSKQDSYQIFFPVTGGLDIIQGDKEYSIDTGQVQVLNVGKGEVLEISNPYPNDVVNYIQMGISTDMFLLRASEMLFGFDFDGKPNQLIQIVNSFKLPFKLSAGIFSGREEAVYITQGRQNKFFCLVIDGAFEIEGRLLHARDALALWDIEQVEIEALSNNAIVLILEFS